MTAEEMLARLLYRDGLMLVIDKPAGLPVHRGPKGGEAVDAYFDALRFGLPRDPALAHRLDKDTSGCLVLGRHRKALAALGHEVIVADPNVAPMCATRSRKIKTDRRDARALCDACELGAYRAATSSDYTVGGVLHFLLYHLGELDLYLGVLPAAALLALWLLSRRRRAPGSEQML